MRIVFIGASDLSLACLESLPAKIEVCGIITAPRQFRISYSADKVTNIRYADLGRFGDSRGIPVYEMQKNMLEEGVLSHLAAWRPNFILVIGWYHMVPKKIRALAPLGTAGIHASLLPLYSGGAPLVWAMINQEKETGITFFYMEDGVDNGDIISQTRFSIEPKDTIADLLDKTRQASISTLQTQLPLIAAGKAARLPQNESARTLFPQRSPADGKIDWQQPAPKILSFVRAQTKPYPGAFGLVHGEKLTIWEAAPMSQCSQARPGTVLTDGKEKGGLCIQTGASGSLEIIAVQWQGKDMTGKAFLEASGIRQGDTVS